MNTQHLLTAFVSALLLWGCKTEPIPAYLRIEPFKVNETGGAAWQDLSAGWVYVDGELLGAYSLPAEVPVLKTGDNEVQVFPGVNVNGIDATPTIYPFFKRYSARFVLEPGVTTNIYPELSYSPDAKEPASWSQEDGSFDGASSIGISKVGGSADNTFSITTDGAFAGKCLLIPVDTGHIALDVATQFVNLPNTGGEQVWLEMHHANNISFDLLLQGKTSGSQESTISIFRFNPSENEGWNKIYFNLTEYVVALKETEYRLYFRVRQPLKSDGTFELIKGTVRLDNLRLFHF